MLLLFLHNAMRPGLVGQDMVGKGLGGQDSGVSEPAIGPERMLPLTAARIDLKADAAWTAPFGEGRMPGTLENTFRLEGLERSRRSERSRRPERRRLRETALVDRFSNS